MDNNQLINTLTIVLGIMLAVLLVLCVIFVILRLKTKEPKKKAKKINDNNSNLKKQVRSQNVPKTYSKQSIFKFMEFDTIKDNMIVQNEGKRYLMVIGCQGINFDLMSGIEKNSVEQGFLQFLNSLRYPIQIYVQTRTVNLGRSIDRYKDRVRDIEKQYRNKESEFSLKLHSGQYSKQEIDKDRFELTRERNLYEYGLDIVNNTERMSLNRNILSKHYYVIISYYAEQNPEEHYGKDEIASLAFSELYTKAQSIIGSLSVCGVNGKILDSYDLAELLYVAYNRDESETFDLQRAMNGGYEDLYSTSENVLDKRIKELDKKIENDAMRKANDEVYQALFDVEKERKVKQKEAELDDLIDEMAKALIIDNKETFGYDVSEKAVENIDKEQKAKKAQKQKKMDNEGGEENVNVQEKPKARRPRISRAI